MADKLAGLAQSIKGMLGGASGALNPYNFTFLPKDKQIPADAPMAAVKRPAHALWQTLFKPRIPLLDRTTAESGFIPQIKDDLKGIFQQKPDASGNVRPLDRTRHAGAVAARYIPGLTSLAGLGVTGVKGVNALVNQVPNAIAAEVAGPNDIDGQRDVAGGVRSNWMSQLGLAGVGMHELANRGDYKWPLPYGLRESGLADAVHSSIFRGTKSKNPFVGAAGDVAGHVFDAERQHFQNFKDNSLFYQATTPLRYMSPKALALEWGMSGWGVQPEQQNGRPVSPDASRDQKVRAVLKEQLPQAAAKGDPIKNVVEGKPVLDRLKTLVPLETANRIALKQIQNRKSDLNKAISQAFNTVKQRTNPQPQGWSPEAKMALLAALGLGTAGAAYGAYRYMNPSKPPEEKKKRGKK